MLSNALSLSCGELWLPALVWPWGWCLTLLNDTNRLEAPPDPHTPPPATAPPSQVISPPSSQASGAGLQSAGREGRRAGRWKKTGSVSATNSIFVDSGSIA